MRLILHAYVCVDGLFVLVKDEAHLFRMEINAACLHAFFTQFGRQFVESQDFVLVVSLAAFNHGLHLFIRIASARLDDGLANPLVVNLGIVVHFKDHTESQFFLIGTQRTHIIT